jgi:hypothetical protein
VTVFGYLVKVNAEPNSFAPKMVSAHACEMSEQIHCTTQCRNTEDHELSNTCFEKLHYLLVISYSIAVEVILLTNIMHVAKMKTFSDFICWLELTYCVWCTIEIYFIA